MCSLHDDADLTGEDIHAAGREISGFITLEAA